MRRSWLALLMLLPVLITACAPGTQALVSAPTFTVIAAGTGFRVVDPPGVGPGTAVFDVRLRAHNPNPIGLSLASLDGDLYLGGSRAASAAFRGGVDLPAQGSGEITVEIRLPLAHAPHLIATLAKLIGGGATRYRLDASAGVNVFGTVQRFPRATLARGTVRWNLAWQAPDIRLASQGATLHVDSLTRVVLQVAATLHNPARLGYVVQAPSIRLAIAGATVATASLDRIAAPAGATVPVSLRFAFDPMEVGPALVAQVQAARTGVGELAFRISGPLTLSAPGIGSHQVAARGLFAGTVR